MPQAAGDPNSALNLPESHKPQFASKFSDPNDPIHNGSIVTLLSGGKIVMGQGKQARRQDRRNAKRERIAAMRGREYNAPPAGKAGGGLLTNRKAAKKGRRTMKNVSSLHISALAIG